MIWLRRALAVPVGIVLLALLLLALVFLQISGSFLNPGFYTKELRKADIYEFVLVDVATSALNEGRELDASELSDRLDENPLVTMGLSTEEIVASLNKAFPPDWVQSIAEDIIEGIGGYATKERDGFEVRVSAGDQVVIMVDEVKSLLRRANAYELLFEELVIPDVEDAVREKLPFGIDLPAEQIITSVRRVVPPEWVQAQVEAALDEVTPYAVGDSDSFEIRVELRDRVVIALEEVKRLLREGEAYDVLYDEVIEPDLLARLGQGVAMRIGVVLPRDEVVSTLRQVAPPDWVQAQLEMVIDEAAPYFTGKTDDLAIKISLIDNKRDAREGILEKVRGAVKRTVDGLPQCASGQAAPQLTDGELLEVPDCRPPQVTADEIMRLLEPAIADEVDSTVLAAIPDEAVFTDATLRQTLQLARSEDTIGLIDDVRRLNREGWDYTDEELRQDVFERWGDDGVLRLDDARDFLSDAWVYTEADFREDIADAGDGETLRDFDRARTNLGRVRTFKLVIYVPVILLLITIGFLGGRRWPSRFAWAAASLAVTAAIIFVVFGLLYGTIGESRIDDARADAIEEIDFSDDFPLTERLLVDKAFDIAESVAGDFASGVATKSFILLIVGLIGLGLSLRWGDVVRLVHRARGAPSPTVGP